MADGREEREELKKRLEQEKRDGRDDSPRPDPLEDWGPERGGS
jgi:hypothetical protein